MSKNNIIIVSHCRDEIIYFYEEIDRSSLIILVTKPSSQKDYEIFNNFIIESGCRYIQLDEIDTFDTSFELSNETKNILLNIVTDYANKVITQAKATMDSDIVSRRIYDYISSLQLDNHYIPKYNLNNNRNVMKGADRYMRMYSMGNVDKYNIMLNTYKSVVGMKLV
jgi:hypothetical protein